MELKLQGSGSVTVSDKTFGQDYKEALVHQVVTACMAGSRAGTSQQKTRSDVSGGGIKPWRQKGTGRARAGTSRSPIWTGGGVTFASRPRGYTQKINRKMYRAAMRSILSELIREERLLVVEDLILAQPKTRDLVARLQELNLDRVLLLVAEYETNICLAARNLHNVDILDLREINPVSLVRFPKVLATAAAIRGLEERLA